MINIGIINQYVDVNLESGDDESTRIVCTFLNQRNAQSVISCDVVYWLCRQQNMTTHVLGIRNSSITVTVIINLPISLQSSDYCYTINASNGTFTVLVQEISSE